MAGAARPVLHSGHGTAECAMSSPNGQETGIPTMQSKGCPRWEQREENEDAGKAGPATQVAW